MEKERCCGTCKYCSYDKMQGYVCVSGESGYCADFVDYDFVCEDWIKGAMIVHKLNVAKGCKDNEI